MDLIEEGGYVRVQYPVTGALVKYEPRFRLRLVNRLSARYVLETPKPVEFRANGRGPDGLRIHPADLAQLPVIGPRQPADEEIMAALDEHPISASRARLRIKSRPTLRGCKAALQRLAREGTILEVPWRPGSARPGAQYARKP
jgi:hypothetical protein